MSPDAAASAGFRSVGDDAVADHRRDRQPGVLPAPEDNGNEATSDRETEATEQLTISETRPITERLSTSPQRLSAAFLSNSAQGLGLAKTMTAPLPPATRVGILAKSHLHAAASHLVDIGVWLERRGVQAIFETDTAALMPASIRSAVATKQQLATDVDMVLVLGGDGTLLGMADCIGEAGSGIPILGVNFGSLGFLTEVTLPELYPSLEAALDRAAPGSKSGMMLRATVRRGGAAFASHIALNDVVVTKAARSRMIDLSVWVGDEFVTRVKADGLSSPRRPDRPPTTWRPADRSCSPASMR